MMDSELEKIKLRKEISSRNFAVWVSKEKYKSKRKNWSAKGGTLATASYVVIAKNLITRFQMPIFEWKELQEKTMIGEDDVDRCCWMMHY